MGQYYHAILLDAKGNIVGWMAPFMGGMKLMEHSYLESEFVNAFECELMPGGRHHCRRVVWAGDYADSEPNMTENLYTISGRRDDLELGGYIKAVSAYPFLVNHTARQFVNKSTIPASPNGKLHPLPLLTCEGNGRGGGDFCGENTLIGSWARDVISVEQSAPEGFTELVFDMVED